jgi:4-hydroxy-tetrahydrodipicolinate reductase
MELAGGQAPVIHSVRLPGLLAHQEVLLGGTGELLTIRHDSFSRESFVAGMLAAVRAVVHHRGLSIGLDAVLGESA